MRPTVYAKFGRTIVVYFGLLIVFVLAINVPFGTQSALQSRGPLLWVAIGACLALSAGGCAVLLSLRKRLDRALNAEPRLACPWCSFDLSRSAEQGRCPECAALYEHQAVERYWEGIKQRFDRARCQVVFASDRPLLREVGLVKSK